MPEAQLLGLIGEPEHWDRDFQHAAGVRDSVPARSCSAMPSHRRRGPGHSAPWAQVYRCRPTRETGTIIVTNRELHAYAEQPDTGRSNPVRSVARRRFLRCLHEGPFTEAELLVELDQLDLSDLADSTAAAYRSAIQSFIRDVSAPSMRAITVDMRGGGGRGLAGRRT